MSNMIYGVTVTPLTQISDKRGTVMHMLNVDSSVFERFGEIYFSCTYPGAIKAWHLHQQITLNYACVMGKVQIILYDDRSFSTTNGMVQELFLSPECYSLVTVPPNIWNGFRCIGSDTAIVANCATQPHVPSEITRKPAFDPSIPYQWSSLF